MEQPTPDSIAGIKYATLVASFLGSAISLSYAKELTRAQAAASFGTGVAVAVYAAPVALHYLALEASFERAVAFALGLVSMRLIPALLSLVDKVKDIKLPWTS